MSTLLQQLQSLGGGVANEKKQYRRQPSFLFDDKTASTISLEQFYEIGVRGLNGLIQRNRKFASYQNTLFHKSFMQTDREVSSKAYNDALDNSIRIFLTLLSPHFLETCAQYCLEYLLQVYRIHEYNGNSLLECGLPFHESVLFTRLIQLIPLKNVPLWSFLQINMESGAPLARSLLIDKAMININVLLVASKVIQRAVEQDEVSDAILSFWTTIATGIISRKNVNEAHLQAILSQVHKGLFSEDKDRICSSLLIITSAANHITMTMTLITEITESLCKAIRTYLEMSSQSEFPYIKLLYNTLMYLLGASKVDVFSDELRSTLWSLIPWHTSTGISIVIFRYLEDELRHQPYALELFSRALVRMVHSSMLTNGMTVEIIKKLILISMVNTSQYYEGETTYSTLFKASLRALKDCRNHTEENFRDHPAFSVLKSLRSHDFHAFDEQMKVMTQSDENRIFLSDSILSKLTDSDGIEAPGHSAQKCFASITGIRSDSSHSMVEEAFQKGFITTSPIQLDDIQSLLGLQIESLIAFFSEHTMSASYESIAPLLASKMHQNFLLLLKIFRQGVSDQSSFLNGISIFANMFYKISTEMYSHKAIFSGEVNLFNICTAVRLVNFIQNHTDGTMKKTLQNCIKLSENESSLTKIVAKAFPAIFQLLEQSLNSDMQQTINCLVSVDRSAAYFIILQAIPEAESVSAITDTLITHLASSGNSKSTLMIQDLADEDWENLLSLRAKKVEIQSNVESSSDKLVVESILCRMVFLHLIRCEIFVSQTLSTNAMDQLEKLYAAQNNHNEIFHDILSLLTCGTLQVPQNSPFVEGVVFRGSNTGNASKISDAILSFCVQHRQSFSSESWSRLIPLILIPVHNLSKKHALKPSFVENMRRIFSDDSILLPKNLRDGMCAYISFIESKIDTFHNANNLDHTKFLEIAQLVCTGMHLLTDKARSGRFAQKAISIQACYTTLRIVAEIFTGKQSLTNFFQARSCYSDNSSVLSAFLFIDKVVKSIVKDLTIRHVPMESMVYLVQSTQWSSVEEVMEITREVSGLIGNLEERDPIPYEEEFSAFRANDVILLTLHSIFKSCSGEGIPEKLYAELLNLLLALNVSKTLGITSKNSVSSFSFSLEDIWLRYTDDLLKLLCFGIDQSIMSTKFRSQLVQLLQILQTGISFISKKDSSHQMKRIIQLIQHDLKSMYSAEAQADAFTLYSAELNILILRDLRILDTETSDILRGIFIDRKTNHRVERLILCFLKQKWEQNLEGSSFEIQKDGLREPMKANITSTKTSELLMTTINSSESVINDILHFLGEVFQAAESKSGQNWSFIVQEVIDAIYAIENLPSLELDLITFMTLRFLHESKGFNEVREAIRKRFAHSPRSECCTHILQILRFLSDFGGHILDMASKKRRLEPCTTTFKKYLSTFCADILFDATNKESYQVKQESSLEFSECSLLSYACAEVSAGLWDSEDLYSLFGTAFRISELLPAIGSDILPSMKSFRIYCLLVQHILIEDSAVHNISSQSISTVVMVLIESLGLHSTPNCVDIDTYHTILQTIRVLIQSSSGPVDIAYVTDNADEKNILPGLSYFIERLIDEASTSSDASIRRKYAMYLTQAVQIAVEVLSRYPAIEQKNFVPAIIHLVSDIKSNSLLSESGSYCAIYFDALLQLFDIEKIAVAMLKTRKFYEATLSSVAHTLRNNTDSDIWQRYLLPLMKKMDSNKALEAFGSVCIKFLKYQSSSNPATNLHIVHAVSRLVVQALDKTILRQSLVVACIEHITQIMIDMWKDTEQPNEMYQSVAGDLFNGLVAICINYCSNEKVNQIEQLMQKILLIGAENELSDSNLKKSQLDHHILLSCLVNTIGNQLLYTFQDAAVQYFAFLEKRIAQLLHFIVSIDSSFQGYKTLVSHSKGQLGSNHRETVFHKPHMLIQLLRENILIAANSVELLTSTLSGQKLMERSTEVENNIICYLPRILCHPLWQFESLGDSRLTRAESLTKAFDSSAEDVLTKTIEMVVLVPGENIPKCWQLVQKELLHCSTDSSIADVIADKNLRAQISLSIRSKAMASLEAIYRAVGPPMAILLRDVLTEFSNLIEDPNAIIKSLARKTLHTIADASGQSIDEVFSAM